MKKIIILLSVVLLISIFSGCIAKTVIFEQNLYKRGDDLPAPYKPQNSNVVIFTNDDVFEAVGSNHPSKVFESVSEKIETVFYFNNSTKLISVYAFGRDSGDLLELESNEYYFVYALEDCILIIEGYRL